MKSGDGNRTPYLITVWGGSASVSRQDTGHWYQFPYRDQAEFMVNIFNLEEFDQRHAVVLYVYVPCTKTVGYADPLTSTILVNELRDAGFETHWVDRIREPKETIVFGCLTFRVES